MKYLKIGTSGLIALVLIISAIILRLIYISQGWPLTNSDEGTIGIMARHIAYQGEHPIFYYGQNYMGVLQAYLGAALFHIFGSSLFTLRLGLLLMIACFLLTMYLLARLLYAPAVALLTLAVLGAGSSYVLARQLSAIGGYPETLLFGALTYLLACWLAVTYNRHLPMSKGGWRYLGYACCGLTAGLGLYSDLLTIPFVAVSALLLLLICWRELVRIVPVLCGLAGLVLGMFPLLIYNLHAGAGSDSLSTLMGLQKGDAASHRTLSMLWQALRNTISVSISMMTGNPFCPVTELPFLGPTSAPTIACKVIHWSWGLGYMLLFVLAGLLALVMAWKAWSHWWRQRADKAYELEGQRTLALSTARLLLWGGGLLTLLPYAVSSAAIDWPGIHARYLIGILIATPALLWPLWNWWKAVQDGQGWKKSELFVRVKAVATRFTAVPPLGVASCLLALIVAFSLLGTLLAFGEIAAVQAANQRDQNLINRLVQIGARHIYTDYWTCNKIAFISNEQIICGVVDNNLAPSHNRVPYYYETVSRDPRSAYVFLSGQLPSALVQKLANDGTQYRKVTLDGYEVYLPT